MTVVVVGASVRAAAQSLRRAGQQVFGIDLFADRDLRALAPCLRLPFADYPFGFLRLLEEAPPGPVMYTGGLENYPDLIDEIAIVRPLLGNDGVRLRKVRDPFFVDAALRERGLPHLELSERMPSKGRWLWKPLRGSAGQGIAVADPATPPPADGYYQRFAEGDPYSATFIAEGDGNSPRFMGICRQIIGAAWLNAPPFRYAGNIGPISLPETAVAEVCAIGEAVSDACGLRGYFGFDFLLEADQPLLCEVNPRYTASVELFEMAQPGEVVGKAILYAPHRHLFPDIAWDGTWADIPNVGEVTEAGFPICTRFAMGPTAEVVEDRLREIAGKTYELLRCRV